MIRVHCAGRLDAIIRGVDPSQIGQVGITAQTVSVSLDPDHVLGLLGDPRGYHRRREEHTCQEENHNPKDLLEDRLGFGEKNHPEEGDQCRKNGQ